MRRGETARSRTRNRRLRSCARSNSLLKRRKLRRQRVEGKNDAREAVVSSLQIVAVPIGCGEILQGSNISTGRPAAVKSEKQIYIQSGKVGSIQKLLDAAKCKKLTQSDRETAFEIPTSKSTQFYETMCYYF